MSEGWVRRFTATEPRLSEAVEMYRQLGYDVKTLPVDPEAETCAVCLGEQSGVLALYTRDRQDRRNTVDTDINLRILRHADLDAITRIDAALYGAERHDYFRRKLALLEVKASEINESLVAEADGRVVGFLMGAVFVGDFGIPGSSAAIEAMGVDPEWQKRGVGRLLMDQFVTNMRVARVDKIFTQVDWKDGRLLRFFADMGFAPSLLINLDLKLD